MYTGEITPEKEIHIIVDSIHLNSGARREKGNEKNAIATRGGGL